MKLIIKGKVETVSDSEFEGKVSYTYQFLSKNKGKLNLVNVKSDKDLNIKEGSEVEIHVSISTFDGKVFYKAV